MAPLVRNAFEFYASGRYNLDTLNDELFRMGLRNRRGNRVSRNGLSTLLNKPFYTGLIRLIKRKEVFLGVHQPLIAKSLFDRVQRVLDGETNIGVQRHAFLFRRPLTCRSCEYSLIGERQKGHAYYRCNTKRCITTCLREEVVEERGLRILLPLQFDDNERRYMEKKILGLKENWGEQREEEIKAVKLNLSQLKDRLDRLTDTYIDRAIEKDLFEERKTALLLERKDLEERLGELEVNSQSVPNRLTEFIELAGNAYLSYKLMQPEEKRDFLRIVTSNRQVDGKNVIITLSLPFDEVASRFKHTNGRPHRDIPRTWDRLLKKLMEYFKSSPSPLSEVGTRKATIRAAYQEVAA